MLKRLTELYTEGRIQELAKALLPTPDSSYDALESPDRALHAFLNYCDACFYGDYHDILQTNIILEQFLLHEPSPQDYSPFLIWLECDRDFAAAALQVQPESVLSPFQRQLIESAKSLKPIESPDSCAPRYQEWYRGQQAMVEGWLIAQQTRPEWMKLHKILYPSYALPYFCLPTAVNITHEPALYIFDSWNHFLQSLQEPEFRRMLLNPKNGLFILDQYPNTQLISQKEIGHLPKVFLSPHALIQEAIPFLTKALNQVLEQPDEALRGDTEIADVLYKSSQQLLYSIAQNRLGKTRAPALLESSNMLSWHNPHKGKVAPEKLYPAPQKDLFADLLKELSAKRPLVKTPSSQKPIKLTHIVPQIVDDQHAPSRLLESLIQYHDPQKFQVDVVVTERLAERPIEYPHLKYLSLPTGERGAQRVELLMKMNVPVLIFNRRPPYLSEAEVIASHLNNQGADIAVFHAPDVINTMAAQMTSAPLRVLFEHGTATSYPGYDLMIASSDDAPQIYGEALQKFHTAIAPLPFRIDVRKNWPKDPPSLKDLGLPEDALVMTTVSGHLYDRLGSNMLGAIAAILKKVPQSYYAPIGPVTEMQQKELFSFFKAQQVDDRVRFLGFQLDPGQISRCMKLYLNEFPFGSCLGMLDAMAAGCAVVSMHDPDGPSQARYGADFLGIERTIPKGDIQGYIDLACRLLSDPHLFREWSAHSLKQYEKHSNVKEYVNNFEKILIDYIRKT